MRSGVRGQIAVLGLAVSLIFPLASRALAACGDAERATPFFKALEACDRARSALTPEIAKTAMSEMAAAGYCRASEDPYKGAPMDQALCANPSGFVCGNGTLGKVMDSQCNLSDFSSETQTSTPGWVEANCRAQSEIEQFTADNYPAFKDAHCKGRPERDCKARFKVANADSLSLIERKEVYLGDGKARLTKVKTAFNRVIQKYLDLIIGSSRIPDDKKAFLVDRINHTRLALDTVPEDKFLSSKSHPGCYNLPPVGPPDSNIMNDPNPDEAGNRLVHVCMGTMANMDRMNPYTLMLIFGHEISHSLDPCSLENYVWDHPAKPTSETDPARGQPDINLQSFPGTMACIRGGGGNDGCEGSPVIACSPPKELYAPCNTAPPSVLKNPKLMAGCRAFVEAAPDCSAGRTNESFADFMGSEVTGRLIADDNAGLPPLNAGDRRDALVSIAATFGLMGCDNKEVRGHPGGYLRTNRMIMGSAAFRQAVGCSGGAPATPEAGVTCKGF